MKFQGNLKVQSIVRTSFRVFVPWKTKYVLNTILMNIVKKKIKNPYLKYLDFKNLGIGLFLDNFNLLPNKSNSCPLPQYLLQ